MMMAAGTWCSARSRSGGLSDLQGKDATCHCSASAFPIRSLGLLPVERECTIRVASFENSDNFTGNDKPKHYMTTHAQQGNPPKIERRGGGFLSRIGGGALTVAIIFHGILAIIGALWVFKITREPEKTVDFMPAGGGGGERAAESVSVKRRAQITPTTAVKRVFAEGAAASYSIPEQGDDFGEMSALSSLSGGGMSGGLGGSGSGSGFGKGGGAAGGVGMAGGGLGIKFFGLQTNAKRIAFLLDYSGSMSGEIRKVMERELAQALKKLSPDTQVLVIPWAGPAWLYNETAPQIMSKWKKVDPDDKEGYDNFAMVAGAHLDPPPWISTGPSKVEEIMKGIRSQVAAQGGTDWRQPFRYAMEASPPPDVIIFMTDGQIPEKTARRSLSAIDISLKKGSRPPVVNCLWIKNPTHKSDHLQKLAQRYKGEFREVSAESASKE